MKIDWYLKEDGSGELQLVVYEESNRLNQYTTDIWSIARSIANQYLEEESPK